MVRVYQYPLRPTKAQEAVLELWLIKSAELYNAALKQRQDAWNKQRRTIRYNYQCVPVGPRGTSQRCSNCGNIVLKMLSEREHRCDKCGLALHRDENAACNVLALGLSAGPSPEVASATEPPYFTLR
jgi:transposase